MSDEIFLGDLELPVRVRNILSLLDFEADVFDWRDIEVRVFCKEWPASEMRKRANFGQRCYLDLRNELRRVDPDAAELWMREADHEDAT